jgi:hypothetical protein
MLNSLQVTEYKADLLRGTGYESWLNFFLNYERYNPSEGKFVYICRTTEGNLAPLELPFNMVLLENLVMEEFKMILEHLSCTTFEDFDQLVKRRNAFYDETTEPINLIVRTVDGTVYLRRYMISELSLNKLQRLYEKDPQYKSHQERPFSV